ncbi:ABC transporter substrate-binding protein [Pseudoalteromonas umbrosa]|uniref:ABC transporter substrate-binding protein n=1 Tax=Pseudoalteromonas umbrosa TaxID=3048489 RepID=UPI0024C26850|nr:ABC transporter substrate-binding protein [Pseudoalteromonas sp. B95]MDK1286365.1 ABC transporter substrate-binding protein [Pseudoalteromonas sp. B95]
MSNTYASNKTDVISIPLNNWMSQRVLSHALGNIIEGYGYTVTYHDMPASDQWGAMQKGLVHFQIEIWQQSMSGQYNRMVANNMIVDLGVHSVVVREEWWYPKYVEELCPGLPDWQALNKCSKLFSKDSDPSKGVFYTIDWNYQDADLIRALDMNFTIERLQNEEALWQKLEEAWLNKKPIILINWTPNWTDLHIPGRFVEFPTYSIECETDVSWGINPNLLHDCGNPKKGWLRKAGWPQLEKSYPCVYDLIKKIDFSQRMIADAASFAVFDGNSEAKAAKRWAIKYRNDIAKWVDTSCSTQ